MQHAETLVGRDLISAYTALYQEPGLSVVDLPDGSGMKNTVADFAKQPVSLDRSTLDGRGIDTPQGAYFLKQYLRRRLPYADRALQEAAEADQQAGDVRQGVGGRDRPPSVDHPAAAGPI